MELIVEESEWEPPPRPPADDNLVRIQLAFPEEAMRRRVKEAGGRGDPQQRVWELCGISKWWLWGWSGASWTSQAST